jgi:hypothetical protein
VKKVTIKYSVSDDDGCPTRSYEHTIPYEGYFNALIEDLNSSIELFEYRQEKYRQSYIKQWHKDPFEGWENE